MENLLGLFERRAQLGGDEILGHHVLGDRTLVVPGETDVAVGQDSLKLLIVVGNWYTANVVVAHYRFGVGQRVIGSEGDRIDDHSALAAFDLVDLFSLLFYRKVAVDDAEAALAGEGNCQLGFGDGIHGRADDGDVQREFWVQADADVDVGGQQLGVARHEQNVVEGHGVLAKEVVDKRQEGRWRACGTCGWRLIRVGGLGEGRTVACAFNHGNSHLILPESVEITMSYSTTAVISGANWQGLGRRIAGLLRAKGG